MAVKRYCILLVFTFLCTFVGWSQGQTHTESFEKKIYFREAYRYVEPSYRNNAESLDKIRAVIESALRNQALVSVEIQAWASPKGSEKYNEQLARNRTNELARWIMEKYNVPADKVKKKPGGVGWHTLRELVLASDVAYRESVVDIIDNVPVFVPANRFRSRRMVLMAHDHGRTWQDMMKRFFPDTRFGVAVVVNTGKVVPVVPDTVKKAEVIESVVLDTVAKPDMVFVPVDTMVVVPVEEAIPVDKKFSMAVRTNMLYDALLVPNIGMEFNMGKRFTVSANWMYGWWSNDRKHNYWRIYGGDINIRKYFGRKAKEKSLHGHHIGLYGMVVTYDFEFGGRGVMGGVPGGDIFDKLNYGGGIEYGYSTPIGRRLNLDFTLGLGYLGGEYQEYVPKDDCYVWTATKNRHYWGPTKAEVSLVWLLGRENYNRKKGGSR